MVRVSGSLKDRLAFFESQEKLNGADSEQTKKNDVPTKVETVGVFKTTYNSKHYNINTRMIFGL